MQEPLLRKYYTDVLKYSAQGNAALMAQIMEKLDKALAEEEKSAKK